MAKISAPNDKYDIDWKKVDDLLMAGCTIVDIAAHFGCDRDTLYYRFERDFGSSLSAHADLKRKKGDNILKAQQYAKALGLTDKGDNTLLIWLGKCRLKQKENGEDQDKESKTNTDLENRNMYLEALINKYEQKHGKIDDNALQDLSETESKLLGGDSSI
jgi:hypothetical protein